MFAIFGLYPSKDFFAFALYGFFWRLQATVEKFKVSESEISGSERFIPQL